MRINLVILKALVDCGLREDVTLLRWFRIGVGGTRIEVKKKQRPAPKQRGNSSFKKREMLTCPFSSFLNFLTSYSNASPHVRVFRSCQEALASVSQTFPNTLQEEYELVQRKFMKQIGHFARMSAVGLYPRLIAVDVLPLSESLAREWFLIHSSPWLLDCLTAVPPRALLQQMQLPWWRYAASDKSDKTLISMYFTRSILLLDITEIWSGQFLLTPLRSNINWLLQFIR